MEKYIKSTKKKIKKTGIILYNSQMVYATSGNISIKLKDGNIIITKSGSNLGNLKNKDLILIDNKGCVLDGSEFLPSSEKYLHIEIYKKREDIISIIHTHCGALSAFSLSHLSLPSNLTPEAALYFPQGIPLVKYQHPSTLNLANEVSNVFSKNFNAAILANHGAIFGAKSIKEALYLSQIAESLANIYIKSKILGQIKLLNNNDIYELQKLFGLNS